METPPTSPVGAGVPPWSPPPPPRGNHHQCEGIFLVSSPSMNIHMCIYIYYMYLEKIQYYFMFIHTKHTSIHLQLADFIAA